jgi:peptide/nickel transport system substrate-binding protein
MHNFQAVMWAWTATGEPDDARDLFHSEARSGGQNFVGYSNPAVDALFGQARRSFDPKERAECYRRIGRIVQEDAPYTLMLRAPSLWAFHKRIRGVVFSPMGPSGFCPGVRDWWVPAGQAIRDKR